jgi:hypothetical protein
VKLQRTSSPKAGFTLAEIAVTLLIVGFTLLMVLQGLESAKLGAAHSHNRKVALGLALGTLANAEAGLYWEDLEGVKGTLDGNYADVDERYEVFHWELVVGDDELTDEEQTDDSESAYFDNYRHRRVQQEENLEIGENTDDEAFSETGTTGGPYERVVVRVTFPKLSDLKNTLTIERWIPLEQVFGISPDAEEDAEDGGIGDGRGEDA